MSGPCSVDTCRWKRSLKSATIQTSACPPWQLDPLSCQTGDDDLPQRQLLTPRPGTRSPLVIITLEEDPEVLFINEQFARLFGYTLNDLRRLSDWAQRAYPDPAYRSEVFADWNAAVARAIADHGKVESVEYRVTDKNGVEHPVLFSATVVGQRIFISAVDVSAQREAEESLRQLQKELERTAFELTENIPVGTYTMVQPPEGGMAKFAFMSTRFLELTGLNREEAEADPLKAFACVHPDELDGWIALNTETFEQKKPFRGETRLVVNGKVRWIVAESVPRTLSDGSTVWEGVLTDITERKMFEVELETAKAQAELANRAKTVFLANMSHEIRTPMNAVMGLSELLAQEPLSEQQRDYVQRIANAANLLMAIIDDVLDMSEIESSRMKLAPCEFDPNALLDRIAALYMPLTKGKPVVLTVHMESGLPNLLFGDPNRIEQILGNLLSNAIKFTDSGRIDLIAEPLDFEARSVRVQFRIRDTGSGITNEDQARLFQPFVQVHQRESRNIGGSGLGLSICKRLAALMGGEISVSSKPGVGSEFRVVLPLGLVPECSGTEAMSGQTPVPAAPLSLGHFGVLIADDDQTNARILGELIARLGGQSESVSNGAQVLEHLRQKPDAYDAVLMDVQMPVMDGLTATRTIRQSLGLHALPVIAFTAGVLESQREAALASGMNAVLAKPLRLADLSACLREYLPEKRAAIAEADADVALSEMVQTRTTTNKENHLRQFQAHSREVFTRFEQYLAAGEKDSARDLMQRFGATAERIGASDLANAAKTIAKMLEAGVAPTDADLVQLTALGARLSMEYRADA